MKKNNYILIALGLLFGLISIISPGFAFIIILTILIFILIRMYSSKEDVNFLRIIFFWGITLRFFLLASSHLFLALTNKWFVYGQERITSLFGDSGYYTLRAWWITQYISGTALSEELLKEAFITYGHSGYLYFLALFYNLFGFSPISVTCLNCIVSSLTGIFFYFIAKEIAGRRSAKVAACLIVFFPSLILWSITNLKDSAFIFLTSVILWAFLKLIKFKRIRYLIFCIGALFLQATIRHTFFVPTLLTLGLSYLFVKMERKYLLGLFFIFAGIIFFSTVNFGNFKYEIVNYHKGVVSTGGFVYRLFDEWVYSSGADFNLVTYFDLVRALFKGWLYCFLGPFPWKIFSALHVLAYFQMVIWYTLLPFCLFGLLLQLRYNWKKSIVFALYLIAIGSILALTGGNIGTDFRLRDMVTPIILLFASIGFCKSFAGRNFIFQNNNL